MNSKIKDNFRKILEEAKPDHQKILDQLSEVQPEISDARKRGFSFRAIAEFLKKAGLEVPAHQVRRFCQEVLKERPKRRKQKRKKTISKPTPSKPSQSSSNTPTEPRPKFRVARDDL